jgi:hypothetical protein
MATLVMPMNPAERLLVVAAISDEGAIAGRLEICPRKILAERANWAVKPLVISLRKYDQVAGSPDTFHTLLYTPFRYDA